MQTLRDKTSVSHEKKHNNQFNNQWKSLANHRNALNEHDSHIHSWYLRLLEGHKQKCSADFSGVETAETNKNRGGGIERLSDRWSTVGEDRVRQRQNERDRRTEGSEDVQLCRGCFSVWNAGLNLMRLIHYGQTATALTSHMSSNQTQSPSCTRSLHPSPISWDATYWGTVVSSVPLINMSQ